MKKLIFVFYILIPTLVFSQNVNGIWRGTLKNDSTKQTQQYELALSEYKGNITGYSYTTFIANDSFYYSIKKIKASIKNGELIVEDDEMLANNFPERASKGVKQTTTIQITGDSMTSLTGKWTANKTRTYYAINGTTTLELEKDSTQSSLLTHLDELEKQKQLKLSVAEKKQNPPKIKEEKVKPVKEVPAKKEMAVKKPVAEKKTEPKKETVIPPPMAKVVVEEKKKEVQKVEPVINEPVLVKSETKPINNLKEISVTKEAEVAERKTVPGQVINMISDSLLLSFYDNGIVDGDSISVFLNGKVIVDKERLSEKAMKRVIYFTDDMPDEMQLVLFAENLGTLPPNTGLVIIRDGTNVYDVRFSADFSRNASITFKRRK